MNILCVDDAPFTLGSLAKLLRKEGYNVNIATGYAHALSEFRSFNPDLLITDVSLGDGNGFILAEELISLNDSLKVIIFTGTATYAEKLKFKCLDKCTILSKPVSVEAILKSINSIC